MIYAICAWDWLWEREWIRYGHSGLYGIGISISNAMVVMPNIQADWMMGSCVADPHNFRPMVSMGTRIGQKSTSNVDGNNLNQR